MNTHTKDVHSFQDKRSTTLSPLASPALLVLKLPSQVMNFWLAFFNVFNWLIKFLFTLQNWFASWCDLNSIELKLPIEIELTSRPFDFDWFWIQSIIPKVVRNQTRFWIENRFNKIYFWWPNQWSRRKSLRRRKCARWRREAVSLVHTSQRLGLVVITQNLTPTITW